MYSEDTLRVYAVPQQSGGLCDTYNNTSQVDCVTHITTQVRWIV